MKNTNFVTSNGFLCGAPGCDFLSQNLDHDQDKIHYNLLHRNLTFSKDPFIVINGRGDGDF